MKLIKKTDKNNAARKVVYLMLICCSFGCITTGNKLSGQTTNKKSHQTTCPNINLKTYQTVFANTSFGSRGHVTILK